MATAPNVIPRNKVTWESPKKERKTQWRLPPTALVLAISTAQPLFSLKIRGTKTQASIPSECLLAVVPSQSVGVFTKGTRLRAFHYVLAWDNATQ